MLHGNPILYDYPFMDGTLQATPSGTTDALVNQLTFVAGTVRSESKDRAFVVGGSDGATVSQHERGGTGVLPHPFPASDYSRDGLDDYLYLDLRANSAVSVIGGLSGQELWHSTATDPDDWYYWVELEDATGDGIDDLAVWEPPNVSLLSGSDGSVAWRQSSQYPRDIGDVDGDGLADVGAHEFSTSVDSWSFRSAAFSGPNGTELFAKKYRIDLPGEEWKRFDASAGLYPDLGDVDGEGTSDAAHILNIKLLDDDGGVTYESGDGGVVSGRNGRKLWEGDISELYALQAALDGRGTDFLRVVFSEDQMSVDIEAIDGGTRNLLWNRTFDFGAPSALALYPEDVDGDGTSELLFTQASIGPDGETVFEAFLLDGSTGARRW
jgi:hypothetical protein